MNANLILLQKKYSRVIECGTEFLLSFRELSADA